MYKNKNSDALTRHLEEQKVAKRARLERDVALREAAMDVDSDDDEGMAYPSDCEKE